MANILTEKSRIYIAGHNGMVGSAILRRLKSEGYKHIITRNHAELDLTEQKEVRDFFQNEKINAVILAAAKVGGILANNTYPAEFIYQNLVIQANVIHEAYRVGVERLLFLGSSCIYPKHAPQPMREESLLTGYLEPTNEPYAIAKIAGIKMCESYNRQYGTKYRSVMPTNLYGPNDNFDLESSHVLPAMIRKFHLAKLAVNADWDAIKKDEARFGPIPTDIYDSLSALSKSRTPYANNAPAAVQLWGSGSPKREFLHVDDMASACKFDKIKLLPLEAQAPETNGQPIISHINIGTGKDKMIKELAEIVKFTIDYAGEVVWDLKKPDGMPRKLLDVSRLNHLGWKPKINLRDGIYNTYQWYKDQLLLPTPIMKA